MNLQKGKHIGVDAVNEELEKMISILSDAGCGSEELEKAKQLYDAGDTEALIRYFRKCHGHFFIVR